MSLIHVKSTGTRSSGESAADDWSDANCYPQVGHSAGAWSGATTVIINDETIDEDGPITSANLQGCTSLTVQSRSGARANCIWRIDSATDQLFNAAPVSGCTTVTLQNITVSRSTTMSNLATNAMVYFAGTTLTEVNLSSVILGDFDVDGYADADGVLIRCASTVARTVNLTDVLIRNVNSAGSGFDAPMLDLTGASHTYNLTRVQFENLTQTRIADSIWAYGIKYGGANTYNLTDVECTDITLSHANSAQEIKPFMYAGNTTSTLNIDGMTFTRVVMGSTSAPVKTNGWGVHLRCAYTLKNYHSYDCAVYWTTGAAGSQLDGGQLYISQSDAVQGRPVNNVSATRCHSRSGAALFVSNGAAGRYWNIRAHDCLTEAGVIYNGGGGGTFELSGFLVDNAQKSDHALYVNDGIGVWSRLNDASDKTVTIGNGTVVNCVSAGSAVGFDNAHATNTMTVDVYNVISVNPDCAEDIQEKATGGGAMTVTTYGCVVGSSGTDSTTDNDLTTIADDDLTPYMTDPAAGDYSLLSGIALESAGSKWWADAPRPAGSDGEPFPDFGISIGAMQSKAVPFHPRNLV